MFRYSLFFALFILAACASNPINSSAPAALTPYQTLTPSATSTPELGFVTAQAALPTSTPFTYVVQAGDTMGAIAQKFGVSLDALIAANPSVSPNAMSIGATLYIPTDKNNPTNESTPTPVPFVISQVQCYPTLDNGMWCFALAQNDSDAALENLSARISLLSADGGLVAAQDAIPPLNVIPPHTSLPLTTFFAPPIPADARPRAQILSSTGLAADDARYLPALIVNPLTEIASNGKTARVTGQVSLPGNVAEAKTVWVAVVAYDDAGRVVGFRRWEGSGLTPGASIPFDLTVSSLGSRVARVELFVEARP
jgi:murein DD-endopeptidase MepM/ murein hydrolase activator NlpD